MPLPLAADVLDALFFVWDAAVDVLVRDPGFVVLARLRGAAFDGLVAEVEPAAFVGVAAFLPVSVFVSAMSELLVVLPITSRLTVGSA